MKNEIIKREDSNQLYEAIRNVLIESRNKTYAATNSAMIFAYWSIGKLIVENEQLGNKTAAYGKATLEKMSIRLKKEFGSGYDTRNLRYMRKFYLLFQNWNSVRSELTWTHYRFLLRIEDKNTREWYIEEAIKEGWSSRQLDRQISTFYYDRLLASKETNFVIEEAREKVSKTGPEQFIKDPYVLEFLDLKDYPALRESTLEQALIDNIQKFLLELGRGFCFVARQKRMNYLDENFFIDLIFYHSILKCYVLIDLKIGKLTHGDIGQMDSYIRMFDDLFKNEDDNPTIGLLLCSEKNEAIAKYSILNDSKNIFASKYRFTLPSSDELENHIFAERQRIEDKIYNN